MNYNDIKKYSIKHTGSSDIEDVKNKYFIKGAYFIAKHLCRMPFSDIIMELHEFCKEYISNEKLEE